MSRSALNANKKPWKKTDQQLYVIKQGEITTTFGDRQIYKVRVARWGKFQGVIQKRLFRYDKQLLDYIPGRPMGFNLQDFEAIIQKQDQIKKILQQTKKLAQQDSEIRAKAIAFKKASIESAKKKKIQKQNKQNNQKGQ